MSNEKDESSNATPNDSEKPPASQAGNDEKPPEESRNVVRPGVESNEAPSEQHGVLEAAPRSEADQNQPQPPVTPGGSLTPGAINQPPSPPNPSRTPPAPVTMDVAGKGIDIINLPDDVDLEANFAETEPPPDPDASTAFPVRSYNLEEDREGTRSVLARGLLWLLAFVIGALFVFVGLGRLEGSAVTQTVFPALISLAGTALGFYFGSQVTQNK
jgi:hypothetical protein